MSEESLEIINFKNLTKIQFEMADLLFKKYKLNDKEGLFVLQEMESFLQLTFKDKIESAFLNAKTKVGGLN